MPTGENTEPAGGRVTRSLRKRLTSIDSDLSSRPGTPVNINLQTIPETNTPKKRVTRRASFSNTPSTLTPSKEVTNTPGRRLTRRSSVNFSESDDQSTQIISKPTIPVVKEEEPEVETPKEKPKRVLRSSSKSPNDPETAKKNKRTSKKATNQEKQDEEEIIVLDDTAESETLKSATKKRRASIKKENLTAELEKEKSYSENEPTTPTKNSPRLSTTGKNSSKKSLTLDTPSPNRKHSNDVDIDSPTKSASKRDYLIKQNTPDQSKSAKGGSAKKNSSAKKEKQITGAKSSPQTETSRKTPKKGLLNISGETGIRRLSTSADKNQFSPARAQHAKNSPAKKNLPEPLKNVAFNEEADESTVKNVYPKTPGLVKSKSYILDGSSNDVDKDETFKSKKDHTFEESDTKSDKENSDNEEEMAGLDTKTPYKLKLKAVESSTPIQNTPSKQNKTSEIQEQKEKSLKDKMMSEEEEEVTAFPKSWTKSVSGSVVNTSKIDCIVPEKRFQEKQTQETINKSKSNSSNNSSKNKSRTHNSDVSEAEDDLLEFDDDEEDEEEERRNQKAEKTIFLDDEAMEVPEGEESMDSQERAYLEENEVPEYGESIGSQDSEEDDDCDEEPDEEDAAFVVSDTEVVDELLSSEDEVEKNLMLSKQKSYKRIYQESQSSEEEHGPSKDDTDFCLLVDSSAELCGNKSLNKSLKNDADAKNKSAKDKSLKEVSRNTVEEDVSNTANEAEEAKVKSATPIPTENNISKEDVSRKSKGNSKADVEDSPSKNKTVQDESKANSSKLNLIVQDNDSDLDMQEADECTPSTQNKPETSEIDDDKKEPNLQKSPEKKKLSKSPKRLTQSPKRKSISTEDSACEADFELITEKALNKSRKSVAASANEENSNKSLRKSLNEKNNSNDESKSPSKSTKNVKKLSTVNCDSSDDDSQNNEQEQTVLKSPRNKSLTKSPKRKSLTATAQDENQCNTTINTRKSVSRTISISENEEACNVSKRKSVDNSDSLNDEKNNSKSRKSLNESRKSLIRTSTEETNDAEDQSTVEKTKLSLDEGSEPEETLSASENPLDSSSGKTLNTSKKLRKSLDRNSSLLNESTSKADKSKRRKSMAQESIIEKAKENSSDSEEEAEVQNEQSSVLNKSNRRKSVSRHSMTAKTVESSDDSEEENEEKSSKMESSHGDNVEAQFSNIENESSSGPGKLKRRKSMAQESIIEKANENSSDSEEENKVQQPAASLQNEQSNELNKSNRRKSVSQHSISPKIVESSVDSEEENEEKSSPEITDNEMESSHSDEVAAEFSDEENAPANTTTSKFLGENKPSESSFNQNSSRRKSIAANDSKLDETFQLDPKSSLSSSLHDSLHRSVLRKSINQSQKQKKGDNNDFIEEYNLPSDSEDENNSSEEEEVNVKQKIVSEKGLSVSLSSIQIKKKKIKDAKAIRNSFTIGVSVRKNSSDDERSSEAEPIAAKNQPLENVASSENADQSDDQNSSSSEGKLLNLSEENVLEKVKDVQQVGSYKPRKSMSSSILRASSPDAEGKQKKRIKRTSLYLQEESASNSFVENLAEEKKKISQKKRKSNSFCGVIAPSADEDADKEIRVKEPRSEKKLKKSYETEDKDEDANEEIRVKEPKSEKKLKRSFEQEDKDQNVQQVLSRCEQMIEAANEAKRKAKLEAKKVKVKKPKLMDKEEKAIKAEEKVEIPLISKKEIKRKEKMKKELAKALKQSASVLSKEPVTKAKQSKIEESNPSKRLETEFLESLIELSSTNKKKTKAIETTPPSDKENSKKKSIKQKYRIEDIHKKIESDIETLETACGTVIVEPSTPKKLRYQNGFRESPKTPVGFKIQDINTTNKKSDKKLSRKLKTTSGSFVEEDLNNVSKVPNPNKRRQRKRKFQIEEPNHILPKTQWTPSGVFVEEDLSSARPLANSTATQFLVAPLSSGKKNKPAEVISSSTLNKALSFKNNASKNNKVIRQKSREILHVKQRKMVNDRF